MTRLLNTDEARLAVWQAIEAITIGTATDDKLIVANLAKAGVYLSTQPAASQEGDEAWAARLDWDGNAQHAQDVYEALVGTPTPSTLSDDLRRASQDLCALAALIERPPLDDVMLTQDAAVRSAKAIRVILSALATQPATSQEGEDADRANGIVQDELVAGLKRALQHPAGDHDGWTDAGMEDAFFRWPVIVNALNEALAANPTPPTQTREAEGVRCSICGGRSFTRIDVRQFDGTFAPGPERRCLECKTSFTAQAFAALSAGSAGQ